MSKTSAFMAVASRQAAKSLSITASTPTKPLFDVTTGMPPPPQVITIFPF